MPDPPRPGSEARVGTRRSPHLRVVVDFDGTLVDPNVAIVLVSEFAPGGEAVAREVDQLLHEGRIGLREAWQRQAALLPAERLPEMTRYVRDRVPMRKGAREFLDVTARHRVPVTVVSGGLEFYIREVLDREGLDLPIRSDRLETAPGGAMRVVHPYEHPTCRLCGICKAALVEESAASARTVFIADGSTDRYAAESSDLVFARHRLLEYCRRAGIECFPFDDFGPVVTRFRGWLEQGLPLPPPRRRGLSTSACPISQRLAAGPG